jgi:hypothetical protein
MGMLPPASLQEGGRSQDEGGDKTTLRQGQRQRRGKQVTVRPEHDHSWTRRAGRSAYKNRGSARAGAQVVVGAVKQ